MKAKLQIGLIGKGNDGWIGGLEYIKNLILATSTASALEGARTEMSLVSSENVPEFLAKNGVELKWIPVLSDIPPVRFGRIRAMFSAGKHDRPLDRAIRGEDFDFVYPIDSLSRSVPCRRAAWIPDLQHRVFPDYSTEEELAARERWIASMMADAPTIVFSSQAALGDFEANYDHRGHELRVLRFRVNISEDLFRETPESAVSRYSLPARFLLVSNQFWQHKNHLLLLDAIHVARKAIPELVVAMTGAMQDYRNPGYAATVQQRIDALKLESNVRLLGLIPKRDQLQLVRACWAVVQPSLFEGWSTVVEEARCLGKEILLSDIPVHREQDPPLARYFDPSDPEALARLMVDSWMNADPGARGEEGIALQAYERLFRDFGRDFLHIARTSGTFRP